MFFLTKLFMLLVIINKKCYGIMLCFKIGWKVSKTHPNMQYMYIMQYKGRTSKGGF